MAKTILVVDDSATERTVLRGLLKSEYDVLVAESGEQMLALLKGQAASISAILLDIVMPGMDGFEALRQLRADPLYRQIPVIAATSLTDEDSQVQALALGANGYAFKPFHRELLLHLLGNTIRLHEQSALANALRTDALTGLPNRRAFLETAETMIHGKEPGYYLLTCFDIENFKVVNDQYGAEKGDELLRIIADSIRDGMEDLGGICCRYTADRFGLLYPAACKESDTIHALHHKAVTSGYMGHGVKIRVGRYVVSDLSLPVSAMYDRATLAEESIRGRYDTNVAEYDDGMRASLLHDQQIVNDMDRALRDGEFEPWFQPQYNHATGALIGAEALARWRRNGKLVSPAEFIPVFERNGFIYEMDQSIWEQACCLMRKWLDEGRNPPPISVNISRRDLFHRHFIGVLTGIVQKYSLPYELIRLEVTESAFSESSGQVVAKVDELIRLGFTVEIDDFGSGYSSLNTLKDVPASILKLDMKFFENTANQQRGGNIVESVVRMAKWLGMAVIAEGVEDQEQADYLKSIGCHYIQGYFYARPMPVAEYEAVMAAGRVEPKLTRLQTLKTLDNHEFWNPHSMETLIFNSYVGGACIFEYHDGQTELLRVNEQYERELGRFVPDPALSRKSSPIRFLDAENRQKLFDSIQKTIDTGGQCACDLKLTDTDSNPPQIAYFRLTTRVIARAGERYLFYCAILNMTAQREAERRETESAQQLQIIMSNINGGVSAIEIRDDGTSHFVFNNERYYELYGYSRAQAEAEQLDVLSLVLPEDFGPLMAKVQKIKADGAPAIIDYRIRKRDGRLAYLRANASLMRMEGRGDVITSVVTDITEKRALEDQLRAVLENINGGMSATVLRGGRPVLVAVNEQFFRLLGFDSQAQYEAECTDVYAMIHPEDRARVVARFEAMDGGQDRYAMAYRIIRRDGAVRYIQNNISVVSLFGVDEPVQLSVASDITELRAARQQAEQTADKLQAVLDHAGNGITAIALRDGTPEFLFANDKYFEIIGYTREAYARATAGDIFAPVHSHDREALRAKVLEVNREQKSVAAEYRVVREDGQTAWVRSVITVTTLESVDAPVQISVFADITAEKEAGDQLRFLNDSAHELLAQPDSEQAIRDTLGKLMAYFAADRAYVVELDAARRLSRNTYEVCADGVAPQATRLQEVSFQPTDAWYAALSRNQFFVLRELNELGEDDAPLRALLAGQDIRALILAPLWRDGRLIGFAGVDNPGRALNQLGRLTALADYIAVLMTRRDLTRKIDSDSKAMQLLANSLPGGLATFACTGREVRLEYCNEGFCRLFGLPQEELLQGHASIMDCVAAEDKPLLMAQMAALMKNGDPISCVYRIRTKDGERKWVNHRAVVTDRTKRPMLVNAVLLDVTEQQEEKERLRVSEEVNRLAIEHSGNIIARFDVRNRTLTLPESVNPIYALPKVLYGLPQEQLALGRVSHETAAAYTALFTDIAHGSPSGAATFQQRSSKGWRWLEAQYTTVFSNAGEPLSAVLSFADVTEKLEKEVIYNKWQQSLADRPEASYTLFRCNLNKDAAFESREGSLLRVAFEGGGRTFNGCTDEYANQYVCPEDRAAVRALLHAETLLAAYYRGRRSQSLEYRELDENGAAQWRRVSVDLVEYPNSKDIEAYLMFEDIDAQKRADLLTLERSQTDALTGILNRATFIARMEAALRESAPGATHALFMLDVDNFKRINDTLGHGAGDEVLRRLTDGIGSILRKSDAVGRLGGDEFFVFLRDIPGREVAAAKAKQLCALQVAVPGSKLKISVSVGIAMIPEDGADFDTLYKRVDHALYQEKRRGKGGYLFVGQERGK